MGIRLHHVNVTGDDMQSLSSFYERALGLPLLPPPPMIATSRQEETGESGDAEWADRAHFFNAGDPNELQIHATKRQPYLTSREGHTVNPLVSGHFAFRTDDIADVKRRLEENDIPYDDWGIWSVEGWYQIFFYDPAGNMIEVHQVVEGSDTASSEN